MTKKSSEFPEGAAVVIGGSGGVGAAVCLRLAEAGANVALTYLGNADGAQGVASSAEKFGVKIQASRLDITDAQATRDYLQDVAKQFGRIHTLVVTTGAKMRLAYLSNITIEEFEYVVRTDLLGFFNIVHAALPLMRDGGGGSIVGISSAALAHYTPMDILSTGPKSGIESIIRAIAREEGRKGIRANVVALGVIEGAFMERMWGGVNPDVEKNMRVGNALKRAGSAEEAAEAVVFLASSRASYISGQRLVVDGGYAI